MSEGGNLETRDPLSRGLAFLAMMLALIASGAAGYVYYRAVWTADGVALTEELEAARRQGSERDERLDARLTAIERTLVERPAGDAGSAPSDATLEARFAAERARIDASVERLQSALGSALAAVPPTTLQWKLAEAEYLLRVGIHRVLMEHDAHGAVPLFRAADEVVKDVDDAALVPVRLELAEAIGELEAVERPDIDGAFVRIEALKKRIGELPLRLPAYQRETDDTTPAANDASTATSEPVSSRIGDRLMSLVRIRRHEGGLKPLLDPQEAGYLEMGLEIALERAQLALLRDDAALYASSLDSAKRRIEAHLDTTTENVRAFLGEIDALDDFALGAPLPDVSEPLRLLKAVARGALEAGSGDEAVP